MKTKARQMKLKSIEIHKINDVPDHILEEVHNCAHQMGEAIYEIIIKYPPNIVLGALNWVHSATTNHLVVEDRKAIEIAAKQQSKALYNNIMHCFETAKHKENNNAD